MRLFPRCSLFPHAPRESGKCLARLINKRRMATLVGWLASQQPAATRFSSVRLLDLPGVDAPPCFPFHRCVFSCVLFPSGDIISRSFLWGFELNSRCLGSETESVGQASLLRVYCVLTPHSLATSLWWHQVWVGLSVWPCGFSVEGRA